jgi:hypothetical protein
MEEVHQAAWTCVEYILTKRTIFVVDEKEWKQVEEKGPGGSN